jgi:hypothetical protein
MKRFIIIALFLWAVNLQAQVMPGQSFPRLCRERGLVNAVSTTCPATGYFQICKVGLQWTLVDPHGHVWVPLGMFSGDSGFLAAGVLSNKYGGNAGFGPDAIRRERSWGITYNDTQTYGYRDPYQILDNSWPDTLQPERMPMLIFTDAPAGSTRNLNGWCGTSANKDLFNGLNFNNYTGYGGGQNHDPYDPCFQTWLTTFMAAFPTTPNAWSPWFTLGESDFTYGFQVASSLDFASIPPGHNNEHIGAIVLAANQFQTYNHYWGVLYTTDRVYYAKVGLQTYLQSVYANITALNIAWGSSYTTFGTSATNFTQSLGTGDGATTTFSITLTNAPDAQSVWIKDAGTVVAGDDNWPGPTNPAPIKGTAVSSGTINYTTKAVSVTFAVAPVNGHALTVDYYSGGWCNGGTGLMDECGAHVWMPNSVLNWDTLGNLTASMKVDLNAFLQAYATKYFKIQHDTLKARCPNCLYAGINLFGSWSTPPRKEVLLGAAPYVDLVMTGFSAQDRLDYALKYLGDKPLVDSGYEVATQDSAYASGQQPSSTGLTQADKGATYATGLDAVLAFASSAAATGVPIGTHSFVGKRHWALVDSAGDNFGFLSAYGNEFDSYQSFSYGCTLGQPWNCNACRDSWGLPCGAEATYTRTGFTIGTGTGAQTVFTKQIGFLPIKPGTVTVSNQTSTLRASDNFMRADANPIGGNWTTVTGAQPMRLVSNQAEGTDPNGLNNAAFWNALDWSPFPDQSSTVTVGTLTSGSDHIGPVMRANGSNFYVCDAAGPTGATAAITLLGTTVTTTINSGDTVTGRVIGTAIDCAVNGVFKVTKTDASIASGSPGIYAKTGVSSSRETIPAWSASSIATTTGTDDNNGNITGSGISSGSVQYTNPGNLSVTYSVAPSNGSTIVASFTQNGWGGLRTSFVDAVRNEHAKVLSNFEKMFWNPASTSTNLFLERPTAASSIATTSTGNNYLPGRSVDGDTATTWQSAATDPQCLRIDLVTPTNIGKIITRWGATYATNYTLDWSDTGGDASGPCNGSWTMAITRTGAAGGVQTDTFTAVSHRYWRINITARSGAGSAILQEMEGYAQ